MTKNEIFELYNELSDFHEYNVNVYINELFNIIVKNGWLGEYLDKYPNEFGL